MAKVLSARQLTADRANLVKGRSKAHAAAVIRRRAHIPFPYTEAQKSLRRGRAAAQRAIDLTDLHGGHRHPLGVREVSIRLYGLRPPHHKPTGLHRRHPTRIAPGGYLRRTGWHASRTHHLKKRLYERHPRIKRVSHWHPRLGRLTPR